MTQAEYREMHCKSALNRVSGMPFRWSLNPYRGCVHGCHYCYARATHPYLGLNAGEDFATRIMVKTNMPDVLERELARPGWRRERVAIGTATDAYQPCEGRYQVTRRCLEALRDAHTPVSIVTKSTLVLRDLDLLKQLAVLPGTQVNFTITTLDLTLWRLIEPGTPPPAQRLAVMRRLTDAGVACSVFIAPILPGLTDSEQSITSVVAAAREHGATAFWAGALRLAPLVKEHYLGFVAQSFPKLLTRYERGYPGMEAPREYRWRLEERITRIRERYGFAEDDSKLRDEGDAVPAALAPRSGSRPGQLTLALRTE
jgi:DNA repair photolyase